MTLDSYCEKLNIKNIDIVKLDIQGGELKALTGAEKLLKNKSILLIYTEVWYYPNYEKIPLLNQLWSCLSLFDYTLFNIYNNINATDGPLSQGDAIFISPEIRGRLNSL